MGIGDAVLKETTSREASLEEADIPRDAELSLTVKRGRISYFLTSPPSDDRSLSVSQVDQEADRMVKAANQIGQAIVTGLSSGQRASLNVGSRDTVALTPDGRTLKMTIMGVILPPAGTKTDDKALLKDVEQVARGITSRMKVSTH